MAEVFFDASSGSAPPSPSVPTGLRSSRCRVSLHRLPRALGSRKDNTPGSQGQGAWKSAPREESAKERERAVKAAEEAVREAAAQLAAVRDGPSVRAEVEKSTGATPPKKAKFTFVTGQERSARVPTGVPSQTGRPVTSLATSG